MTAGARFTAHKEQLGAGGIVCSTEVAGGVRNNYCHNCVFDGTDQAVRIKNMNVEHCKQLVLALGLQEQPLRNILMSNIKANCNSLRK